MKAGDDSYDTEESIHRGSPGGDPQASAQVGGAARNTGPNSEQFS